MLKSTLYGCIMGAFFASCGHAADLPQKAPSAPVAPVSDLFAGWYVGAEAGYGWGNTNPDLPVSDFKRSGAVIGGNIGYRNTIWARTYLGFDASFNWSDVSDSHDFGGLTISPKLQWYGTLGTSLGYLVTPDLLISGTGGLAYGSHKATASIKGLGSSTATEDAVGWYVGASADYSLASLGIKGWTAGVDYKHIDWGKTNYGFPIGPITIGTKASNVDDVVLITGKYKFAL